jgi:hypothetical protein
LNCKGSSFDHFSKGTSRLTFWIIKNFIRINYEIRGLDYKRF